MKVIELNEREWELLRQVQADIDSMMVCLATLSLEQRFQWYRKHQYCHPVNFEKEIGGTVYSVATYFNESATESIEEKTERILK